VTENDAVKAEQAAAKSAAPSQTQSAPQQSPNQWMLSSYYHDSRLKPSSLFKAVRGANLKMFQSEDIASAQSALPERDPSLFRILALAPASRPPGIVERWVMEVAKSSVRALDPGIMPDEGASADTIFERVVHAQTEALQSKSKASRLGAQNLVKLTLLWLIGARSLDPLQALYVLSETSNKPASRESARSRAQKILVQANPGQWKTLSAVARLSFDVVQRADRAAAEATRQREQLQERVAELEKALDAKKEDVDKLSREVEHLRSEVSYQQATAPLKRSGGCVNWTWRKLPAGRGIYCRAD
jgi:hypothetical protein